MDGRVALVTGASRGIGHEVCRILAREGLTVILTARDPARAAEAAAVATSPGRLDVLVNNAAAFAGWTEVGSSADLDVARAVLQLNALTATLTAELAGSGVLVNAVDPGLTATAPGMEEMCARPVAEGAASVAWAALLPDDGPSGGSFRDGRPHPW